MQYRQSTQHHTFFLSLLLHLVMLTLIIISYDASSRMPVLDNSNQQDVIQATMMSPPAVLAAKPIKQPPLVAKSFPKEEIKKIEEPSVKKEVIAISDKKDNLKRDKAKLAEQLLLDLKKEKQLQKKVKQKEMADHLKKQMKLMVMKSLQQQMKAEQERLEGVRTQRAQGEVNKYKALILQAISQNWLLPGHVDKTLYAELLIRVAPGGIVLDVQLMKSSGNEGMDRSAQAAVFKASPLPVPSDATAFEPFRQFVLKVRPQAIQAPDSWGG